MAHLTYHERPGPLRRPVLLMAFAGWNDAAESATGAARFLRQAWDGQPLATLDAEEFYHFGLTRPQVRFKAGTTEREIVWPDTEFALCRPEALARDVLIGTAIEPHLRWKAYCRTILEMARELDVALLVTLGLHLAMQMFLGVSGYEQALTYTTALSRYREPLSLSLLTVLLVAATYHGLFGLRNLLVELRSGKRWNTFVTGTTLALAFVMLGWGLRTIVLAFGGF